MNQEQFEENLNSVVEKIVTKKLDSIVKNLYSILAVGVITAINYGGNVASVRLNNGTQLTDIPYPRSFSESDIGIGQRVLIASPDPYTGNSKFIVCSVGSF